MRNRIFLKAMAAFIAVIAAATLTLDISIRHFLIAVVLIILLLAPLPRMLLRLKLRFPRFATTAATLTAALAIVATRP